MVFDGQQSVLVAGTHCIRVGQHGCQAAQDVPKHGDAPDHGEDGQPLLSNCNWMDISIPDKIRIPIAVFYVLTLLHAVCM